MAGVVSIAEHRADAEMERLFGAMEDGGIIVYLHLSETALLPDALAFEFSKGLPTPEAIQAAHSAAAKYASGDDAFKQAVTEYLFTVGAVLKPV